MATARKLDVKEVGRRWVGRKKQSTKIIKENSGENLGFKIGKFD